MTLFILNQLLFPYRPLLPSARTSVDLFGRPLSLFAQLQRLASLRRVSLVRLAPPLLEALRRMQRLMQVHHLCRHIPPPLPPLHQI